ncbi:hypothetical protein GGR57DRAFT_297670 [Xylariaceae sp. FL1272]|nr:hypothetical protein GGR57DRAFT_297670 [Xylariaceae sp. FL1272]
MVGLAGRLAGFAPQRTSLWRRSWRARRGLFCNCNFRLSDQSVSRQVARSTRSLYCWRQDLFPYGFTSSSNQVFHKELLAVCVMFLNLWLSRRMYSDIWYQRQLVHSARVSFRSQISRLSIYAKMKRRIRLPCACPQYDVQEVLEADAHGVPM